ncbi:MAG: hypothetical protein HEEMFOPI_00835 [Holosporales bacterium]
MIAPLNNNVLKQRSPTSVQWMDHIFPCSIGKSGFVLKDQKQEGDGKTPIGQFNFLYGYYRADRLLKPESRLPFLKITKDLCWCDNPQSDFYNKPFYLNDVRNTKIGSYETMWRDNHLYDIVIVVNHNQNPIEKNKGSAIFIHLSGDDAALPPFEPSRGCLKLFKKDLLTILKNSDQNTIWNSFI